METNNIFTDDLMEDILLRLPVRHLLRFRCVDKSWCALIDSPRFIEKHHQIQSAISREDGDAPIFLNTQYRYYGEVPSQFYLLSKKQGDGILCLTSDLDRDKVPNDDPNHFIRLRCMGVVNGVVGLCWGDDCLGLWNPSTRDFIDVPPPRTNDFHDRMQFGVDIFGLGFDPKSSDFKIVRSMYWNDGEYLCEMYSLSTNSWTSLELASSPETGLNVEFPRTDGFYNGVHYWTGIEDDDWEDDPPRYVILSFDFSTKVFKFFDPPPAVITTVNNMANFDWIVGQYMERLALIFHQNSGEALSPFEIWVASKFDIGCDSVISLSWQRLFTIKPRSGVHDWAFLAFRMDGDVLLNIHTSKSIKSKLYNPSTRRFKNLGLSFHSGYRYVESLFPLSKRQIQGYKGMDKLKKRKRNQNHELDQLATIKPLLVEQLKQELDESHSMKQLGEFCYMVEQLGELGSVKQELDVLGSMKPQLDKLKQPLDELGAMKQQLLGKLKQLSELGAMKQQLLDKLKQQLDELGAMKQQLDVLSTMEQQRRELRSVNQQLVELMEAVVSLAEVLALRR